MTILRPPQHSLLRRQLRKHWTENLTIPKEWAAFIASVDNAYLEFDEDRLMLERALDLSSKELLQANTKMRAVLQSSPDLFAWLDQNGIIRQSWTSDLGNLFLPSRKQIGDSYWNVPGANTSSKLRTAFQSLLKEQIGVTVKFELPLHGKTQYYEARLLPLPGNECLAIERNITESNREEQIRNTEKERLAATLRSIADGVATTDRHGNIIVINEVAQKITGWQIGETLGISMFGILKIINGIAKNGDNTSLQPFNEKAIEQIGMLRTSLTVPEQDTRDPSRTVTQTITPVYDLDGQINGAVIVLRDETHARRIEEERLKASKLESVGLLAGGIAHDFNNILGGLLSNISLSRAILKNHPEINEMLVDAEMAVERATGLTKQLMTFAKGGAPVKVEAALGDLAKEVSIFALRGSNVRCLFDIPDDLWSVNIDIGQIGQVFNNLVINANQAMPEGGTLRITARNVDEPEHEFSLITGGKHLKLTFQDEGQGIPPDVLPHIFDPYFSTKKTGSGLGLATSYTIVQKHHGSLQVESIPKKGATFTLRLPAVERALRLSSIPSQPIHMETGRVLVMDDELQIRKSIQRLLKHLGFETSFALDGEQAIQMCQEAFEKDDPFRIVIMDLTIPGGMGGQEATNILRNQFPELKIIASSGYSTDPVMSDYESYGFTDILPKPYSLEAVVDMLGRNSITAPSTK